MWFSLERAEERAAQGSSRGQTQEALQPLVGGEARGGTGRVASDLAPRWPCRGGLRGRGAPLRILAGLPIP